MLLTRRATRYRERAFVAEGLRAVSALLEQGLSARALLVDASRRGDVPGALLASAQAQDARVHQVDEAIFREMSDVETPQPVVAIFEMPAEQPPGAFTLALALDGVSDPGNLGTILRTAEAAGVDGVFLLRGTVDPYNPKVVRATAGSIGSLPLWRAPAIDKLCQLCEQFGAMIVVASGDGDVSYSDFDWTQPLLLVVGGEATGASRALRERADATVSIPMRSGVESINVTAATAVLLFEAARQRRRV
jgi:TrmH family RNA methyltransferase